MPRVGKSRMHGILPGMKPKVTNAKLTERRQSCVFQDAFVSPGRMTTHSRSKPIAEHRLDCFIFVPLQETLSAGRAPPWQTGKSSPVRAVRFPEPDLKS